VTAIDGGPFQQAAAELIAAGESAVLHRRTAAACLGGLDLDWDGTVDIAVGPKGSRRHQRRSIPVEHIMEVDGLRCTDRLQTLLDLAGVIEDIEWEWALEAALRSRRARLADMEAALVAPGRKDRVAVDRVRRVLALRPPGAAPTGSVLETMFIQLGRRVGAPEPERQVRVVTAGAFRTYADLAWPSIGLFVELDGEKHKGQPVYDARRQTAISAETGWVCGRFTWTEVVHNPTPTGRRLLRLIDTCSRRI